jgi:hypothetical protein
MMRHILFLITLCLLSTGCSDASDSTAGLGVDAEDAKALDAAADKLDAEPSAPTETSQ